MRTDDLWAEFNAARAALEPPDRVLLEGYGIAPRTVVLLIGLTRARVCDGLYEPDEDEGEAFVTPILAHDAISPEAIDPAQTVRGGEMLDLVLWHPRRPDVWALRSGDGEWIGCIEPQYMPPLLPVPIRRSVLNWFQNGCTGLVLLAPERAARYRLLTGCRGGIIAEDAQHLAEMRDILEHPWPHPPITIADGGLRNAA